jgi:protein SCO1
MNHNSLNPSNTNMKTFPTPSQENRRRAAFRASSQAISVVLVLVMIGCSPKDQTSGPQPGPTPTTTESKSSLPRPAEYDYDPPAPGTYTLPVLKPAGDGTVVGPDGQTTSLRKLLQGRVSILSFIYTRCSDPRACPMATGTLYQLHRLSQQDPEIADHLRLITFSFDPGHDTPELMKVYGHGFQSERKSAEWFFLTTPTPREIQPILEAYGQQVAPKKNPKDPLGPFYHNVRVFLIDRKARIRNIYSTGLMDPRLLMADIRTLLLEERNLPLAQAK